VVVAMMVTMMRCSFCRNNCSSENCERDNRKHNPTNLHQEILLVPASQTALRRVGRMTCGFHMEAYCLNPASQGKVFINSSGNNI
jgi:hypothetical protein